MSIVIDPLKCIGCTKCTQVCPVQAISFFLGADIGGNGSTMVTKEKGDILSWIIEKRDGTTQVIDINRKDANKY